MYLQTARSVMSRLGWTGDAQIFCRTATYLMNTYTFYKKWLHDLEVDQTPEGGVPHVVPNIEEGRTDGNWLLRQGPHSAAAWADAGHHQSHGPCI